LNYDKHVKEEGYFVLGHEAGGYIVDPGPWSKELLSGQKAVILPHVTCGQKHCSACTRYKQNLCRNMKHLGFELNGNMAQVMSFPYQCILPVSPDFPDDALPLVEPLACVLRAMFRIKDRLSQLTSGSASSHGVVLPFTIFGAGPMGCLAARAVKRFWPDIRVTMIDPVNERCGSVRQNEIADDIFQAMPEGAETAISFIACSKLQASIDAIASTCDGGTVVLFSGINTTDQEDKDKDKLALASEFERIHRTERIDLREEYKETICRLVGSSGYNFDDSSRSICELHRHYDHYRNVQNVEMDGLTATVAKYRMPEKLVQFPKGVKAVEALLSPRGIYDENYGTAIAEMIKVLIKI
jgi:threonine dehydrogenase-like Zn-dependent dehydrogenase